MSVSSLIIKTKEKILQNCSEVLKFETVSGTQTEKENNHYRSECVRCFQFLEHLSNDLGLQFRHYDNRVAVIEYKGAEKPVLGMASHIDVVPPGDNWTHPPFGGVINDNYLWGRGTLDDKIPMMENIYGLWAAKETAKSFPLCCKIIIGTQEEIGDWSDLNIFKSKEGNPDFGFTPDSDFPIINGEKGTWSPTIKVNWNKNHYDSIIPELKAKFISLKSGDRANIVPDLAQIVLECDSEDKSFAISKLMDLSNSFLAVKPEVKMTIELEKEEVNGHIHILISFIGKRAHGSTPWLGHNAAVDALNFLSRHEIFPSAIIQLSNFLYHRCNDIYAGGWGIAYEHPIMGKNTVNLGVLKISEDEASAHLNFRPPLGLKVTQIRDAVDQYCKTATEQFSHQVYIDTKSNGMEALFVDPNNVPIFFNAMTNAFESVTGQKATLKTVEGTTYAKAFPNFVNFGPVYQAAGEPLLIHQIDERVSLDVILRNTTIYAQMLMNLIDSLQ